MRSWIPNGVTSAAEVADVDSVRLFVERARSVNPHFELTDDNAIDVARLVAHLNGIPLAIELAAAALGDRPLSGVLTGLADKVPIVFDSRTPDCNRPATRRSAPRWNGASTCFEATSVACSPGSPHLPGAAPRRRSLTCAAARPSPQATSRRCSATWLAHR